MIVTTSSTTNETKTPGWGETLKGYATAPLGYVTSKTTDYATNKAKEFASNTLESNQLQIKNQVRQLFLQKPAEALINLRMSLEKLYKGAQVDHDQLVPLAKQLEGILNNIDALTGENTSSEEKKTLTDSATKLLNALTSDSTTTNGKEEEEEIYSDAIDGEELKALAKDLDSYLDEFIRSRTGILPELQNEALSMLTNTLEKPNKDLQKIHELLTILSQGKSIKKAEFNDLVALLKDFKKHPEKFIGRPWNEGEKSPLTSFTAQIEEPGHSPQLNELELQMLNTQFFPKFFTPIIEEKQGIFLKMQNQMIETANEVVQKVAAKATQAAPEKLLHIYEKVINFQRRLQSSTQLSETAKKDFIETIEKMIQSPDEYTTFQSWSQRKTIIELIEGISQELQLGSQADVESPRVFSLQTIIRKVDSLEKELHALICYQEGPIANVLRSFTDNFTAQIGRVTSQFTERLNAFGIPTGAMTVDSSDPLSMELSAAEDSSPSSPMAKAFGMAKNFIEQKLQHLPQTLSKPALQWVNGLIINVLDTAINWCGTSNELTAERATSFKNRLEKAKAELNSAVNAGNITKYLQELMNYREQFADIHMQINGLEVPFAKATKQASTPVSPLTQMIERNQRTADQTADNTDWEFKAQQSEKQFIQNLSYFTSFQLVHQICTTESDVNTFQTLLTTVEGDLRQIEADENPTGSPLERLPEEQQERIKLKQRHAFDKALSDNLWKYSNAGSVKKAFTWLLVRSHLASWLTTKISTKFLNNLTNRLKQLINENKYEHLRTLSFSPIDKLTNFLISHQQILEAFAKDDHSGLNRASFVESKMEDPNFNHGFSSEKLYKIASEILIDQFIPGFDLTENLSYLSDSLWQWQAKSDSTATKTLKFFPALIGQLGIWGLKIPTMLANFGFNKIFNKVAKKCIIDSKLMEKAVQGVKSSIASGEHAPEMDQLVLAQLKEIWELLQSNAKDETVDIDLPDSTDKLREMVNNLFLTLDMRGFLTREQLKNFIENKSLSNSLRRTINETFMDDSVESLVRLIFVVYKSFVNEEQLNIQLTNAFNVANDALKNTQAHLTDEEKALKEAQCIQTKAEIKNLNERILKFNIHKSTQEKIENMGLKHQQESDKYINEMQSRLIGAYHFDEYLDQLQTAKVQSLEGGDVNIFLSKYRNIKEIISVLPEKHKRSFLTQVETLRQAQPVGNLDDKKAEIQKITTEIKTELNRELQTEASYVIPSEGINENAPTQVRGVIGRWLSKLDTLNHPDQNSDHFAKVQEQYQVLEEMRVEFNTLLLRPWRLEEGEMNTNSMVSNSSKSQLREQTGVVLDLLKTFQEKFLKMHNQQGLAASIQDNQIKMKLINHSFTLISPMLPHNFTDAIDLASIKTQHDQLVNIAMELRNSQNHTEQLEKVLHVLHDSINILQKAIKTYTTHQQTHDTYLELQNILSNLNVSLRSNARAQSKSLYYKAQILIQKLPPVEKQLLNNQLAEMYGARGSDNIEQTTTTMLNKIRSIQTNIGQALEAHATRIESAKAKLKDAITASFDKDREKLEVGAGEIKLDELQGDLKKIALATQKLHKLAYIKFDFVDSSGLLDFVEEYIFHALKNNSERINKMVNQPEVVEGLLRHVVMLPLVEKYHGKTNV